LKAPQTLAEARDLAHNASIEHQACLAHVDAARSLYESRVAALQRLVAGHTTFEQLALAQHQVRDAHEDWEAAKRAESRFDASFQVWASGNQFDEDGNDYALTISYSPLEYVYRLYRTDERNVVMLAVETTLADAIAAADEVLYPRELAARPVPAISLEDSTAAGDIVISYQGGRMSIRSIVDQVLDSANQGAGQHYEIFAQRARDILDGLPAYVSDPAERAALKRYLAYDRF